MFVIEGNLRFNRYVVPFILVENPLVYQYKTCFKSCFCFQHKITYTVF